MLKWSFLSNQTSVPKEKYVSFASGLEKGARMDRVGL
jgi:hypothetical protein